MRKSVFLTGAVVLLGLGACGDQLAVDNVGEPDVERVLSTSDGVQSTIAGFGAQLNNPQRTSNSVPTQSKILADESFASVANFGMAARESNRTLIINDIGNDHATSNEHNYNNFQQLSRAAANALAALARIKAEGNNTLSAADENRTRAFAYLILGQAMAYVSFAYDSGAAVTEAVTPADIPELVGAAELNAAGIAALDSAVIIAGRGMSDVPAQWLSQANAVSQARFIRLARSYRARARAGVARTPAQRAALDWNAIIADAENGITADHVVTIGGGTGWSAQYDAGQHYVSTGWGSLGMVFFGMADTSGAYQAWYNTPASQRRAFLVQTADLRWPQGSTRAAQQADTPDDVGIEPRYIRNRETGRDVPAAGTGENWYDHRRYGTAARTPTGPFTDMSKTEIDMLAAEGYLQPGATNDPAAAVALINLTRVANGLPPVTVGGVPAGNCTPRLPNSACGSLLEAMKYEKRMETAYTGYMPWFVDGRGWGDIRAGTALEWPVPYQEMQARQKPFYNGQLNSAGTSTYGFCADGTIAC